MNAADEPAEPAGPPSTRGASVSPAPRRPADDRPTARTARDLPSGGPAADGGRIRPWHAMWLLLLLGWTVSAADRAVTGDGSALYQIQALWTAAHYEVGLLVIVLANARYAVLEQLSAQHGGPGPWPRFPEVSVTGLARSLGCPAHRVADRAELRQHLGSVLPGLRDRSGPLLL